MDAKVARVFRNRREKDRGFTLIELLAVLAVGALVAAELLPAMAANRERADITRCISNHKQLTTAWKMYADDNNGAIVPNADITTSSPSWVLGVLSWDFPPVAPNPDNTNVLKLTGGLLGPYCNKSTSIYKCPADTVPAARGPRVRSVSMNGMMNGQSSQPAVLNQTPVLYQLFVNQIQIVNPNPSLAWVFIDEQADSINDGFFRVDMSQTNNWANLPANYHEGQGMLSYADGHVEPRRWTDSSIAGRTITKVAYTPFSAPANPNTDMIWLQNRTTSLQGN